MCHAVQLETPGKKTSLFTPVKLDLKQRNAQQLKEKTQTPERGPALCPAWCDFRTRKNRQHRRRLMEGTRGQSRHDMGMPARCEVHAGTADTTSYTKQHHPSPKPTGLSTSIPSLAGKHMGFNSTGTHLE